MESLPMIGIFLIGLALCAGAFGFCFLKIHIEFQKGLQKQSPARLWVAFSAAVFTLLLMIIGGTGIGIGLQQQKFPPIRIPIHCQPHNSK